MTLKAYLGHYYGVIFTCTESPPDFEIIGPQHGPLEKPFFSIFKAAFVSILLLFELDVCATVCDRCAKFQLNPSLSGRIKVQELKTVPC